MSFSCHPTGSGKMEGKIIITRRWEIFEDSIAKAVLQEIHFSIQLGHYQWWFLARLVEKCILSKGSQEGMWLLSGQRLIRKTVGERGCCPGQGGHGGGAKQHFHKQNQRKESSTPDCAHKEGWWGYLWEGQGWGREGRQEFLLYLWNLGDNEEMSETNWEPGLVNKNR